MIAYGIIYSIRGKAGVRERLIDARDLKSAKRKIGKSHGYKDGRMIKLERVNVIGYY